MPIRPADPATKPDASRATRIEPAGVFVAALLAAVWSVWAIEEGAFFGVVLLPGGVLLCIGGLLLCAFAPWPLDLRRSPALAVALAALTAFGIWVLLSAGWSPSPDVAVGDGLRVLIYAIGFGLGAWMCSLFGNRSQLSLMPLAVAGAAAGIATIVTLAGTDLPREVLEVDGTLDFPLGYRNANAAFFAIAFLAAVGAAADPEIDWRARSLALGAATLCLDFALLSQSRASMPAIAAALLVYIIVAPVRLRAIGWIVLAALPALIFVPSGLDLYAATERGLADSTDELSTVALMAGLSALAGSALGAVCARLAPRLPVLGTTSPRANRRVAWAIVGLLLASFVAFVVAVGNPVDWIDERIDQFRTAGSPERGDEASRFTFNAGSERYDLWRVALADAGEEPLLGNGGGGFHYSYLRQRETASRDPHDAHSFELETLSEFGIPGLALLLLAIGAGIFAAARSRRRGTFPGDSSLAAVALAVIAYWLVHASVDWFWPYPGVTAPVLGLLGAAGAPAARRLAATTSRLLAPRLALALALAAVALGCVPLYLSERYIDDAFSGWRDDRERAYADLDRARSLNPLAVEPILVEGTIARATGDRTRALNAFAEAARERPEEWAAHYLVAELLAEDEPETAREGIRLALELNPLGERVRALARRLGVEVPPKPSP